jgi:hypothetical protein
LCRSRVNRRAESRIYVSRVRVMVIAWRHSESKHGNSEIMKRSSLVFVFLSISAVRYAYGTDMRRVPTVKQMDMIFARVQYCSPCKKTKMTKTKGLWNNRFVHKALASI